MLTVEQMELYLGANKNWAKDMIWTGRTVKADEALAAGLIDSTFPMGVLFPESLKQAQRLAELLMAAYAEVKRAYKQWLAGDLQEAVERGREEYRKLFFRPQAVEGFAAVLEKRKPKFCEAV